MKVIGPRAMMYVAHPTRIWKAGGSDRIINFVRQKGFAPVNPFNCGDFSDFEGGLVGREGTLNWTLHLQRGCHWTGFCGVSDGTMRELEDRLKWDKEKRVRVFYEDDKGVPFDPKWEEEYKAFTDKYGDLLADLRGKNQIVAVVGPSAMGKTYWIERLIEIYGSKAWHPYSRLLRRISFCRNLGGSRLIRVKNTTTRPPRDDNDENYYNRVTKEKFLEGIDGMEFLEHDTYLGHHYGSSLSEIKKALKAHNGIFAITPKGAMELYRCRFEINVSIILLKPVNEAVLMKNFQRRGEKDQAKIAESIRRSKDFALPDNIKHHVLELTGTKADEERVLSLMNSILK